ncbi:MAG: hypothetical protein QOH92_797 [Chloroflexota bacterium]|jgi:NRPS condensation-like uncharacterized protein|nr:hypothetical protein [Chloroflexota bacterium]
MNTTQLNLLDELYLHLDRRAEPWVVHLEARVGGRLDAERLARALAVAVQQHPIARARLASWRYSDRQYSWDILDRLSEVPFQIANCRDEAALDKARERHFAFSPSLDTAPPFAALLAHVPDGDAIVLNLNHAAVDGIGAVRLMLSILRAYAQKEDPVPSVDPLEVRDVLALAGAHSTAERYRRMRAVMRLAPRQLTPTTRVARDGGSDRPGYGFDFMSLSVDETTAVGHRRTPDTTVNDVLLGALAVTVARWNETHGQDVGRIALTMPVNLRPDAWRNEVVSNLASYVTISLEPEERPDVRRAAAAAGRRTRAIKREGLAGIVVDVLDRLSVFSVGVKRRLPDLIPLTGDVVVDTASLSNLGIVESPPKLDDSAGPVRAMWFSQPGRMPLGTCVGALTLNGRLHLALRYRHAQFDKSAARAFFRLFRTVLLGDRELDQST